MLLCSLVGIEIGCRQNVYVQFEHQKAFLNILHLYSVLADETCRLHEHTKFTTTL